MIPGADAANPKPSESAKTTLYVYTVVILAVVTVSAIVTLKVMAPDDIATGTLILGVMVPLITAFLAAALQGVHLSVNSRMDKFIAANDVMMQTVVEAARQDGVKVGQQQGRILADRRTDDLAQKQLPVTPAAPPPPLAVEVKNVEPIPVTTERKP